MTDRREPLVALGAITRPHGVRGEVRVHRFNPDSEVLLGVDRVWLVGEDGARRPIKVTRARPHGDVILMTFVGVGGRDEADALRGLEVSVPRASLPEPEAGEYYLADLVGLAAVDAGGAPLGSISDVIRYPSADCLVLVSEGVTREIPLLDPYVAEIDVAAGRVVLAHLEDFEPVRSKPK